MSSTRAPDFEAVLEQARRLPADQQLRLVEALQPADDELEPELRRALLERVRRVQEGKAVLHDGRQVIRELRAKYEG